MKSLDRQMPRLQRLGGGHPVPQGTLATVTSREATRWIEQYTGLDDSAYGGEKYNHYNNNDQSPSDQAS